MTARRVLTAASAGLLASAAPPDAPAPDARQLAAAFGARANVIDMSLSPDGTKVAIVSPLPHGAAAVMIADVTTGGASRGILKSSGNPDRLQWCRWTTATRMICQLYFVSDRTGEDRGYTRLLALNADGTEQRFLTPPRSSRAMGTALFGGRVIDWQPGGDEGDVLLESAFVPKDTRDSNAISQDYGLGVERVNTLTMRRTTIEKPQRNASTYLSDGRGVVRVMGQSLANQAGYATGRTDYFYRRTGSREWLPLSRYQTDGNLGTGFRPQAIDPVRNAVYGFDQLDGRQALFRIALDGSLKRDLVFARPDVDVDGLQQVGRDQRIVGVSYATEVRQVNFFDPDMAKLSAAIGRALPRQPIVTATDSSADGSKLLLFAGSDDDPGRYYLLDRATRKMPEVLAIRPQLAGVPLAKVRSVSYAAADGTRVPAYLTLPAAGTGKNLPAIVMPHGGPSARDEWGFDWLAQYFAALGYAVLQPNFRGSAGYGDAWFEKNGFQSWRTAIGDIDDGARWLTREGVAAPGRLAIVGWSYGGYAALQSGVTEPALFRAIVAIAPVTDLPNLLAEARDDYDRRLLEGFVGRGPHLKEGSPAQNASRITAPVLLFHGDDDINVRIAQSRLMAERLRAAGKRVDLVEYKGFDHSLEDGATRADMLARTAAFLRGALAN